MEVKTTPIMVREMDSPWEFVFYGMVVLIIMLLALLAGYLALINWLPGLSAAFSGPDPKVYWYLSRASAIAGYSILWLSMVFGLLLTSRMSKTWPGSAVANNLHEYASLLGLGFVIFHALVLTGDHYIQFTVGKILLPFASSDYKPIWVGIGQLGFYLWVILAASFYLRKRIGTKTWRWVHYLTFVCFMMALIHGIYSGTDSNSIWVSGLYWMSGGVVLFLTIYRIITTIAKKSVGG